MEGRTWLPAGVVEVPAPQAQNPDLPGLSLARPVLELPQDAATQRWSSEGAGPSVPHRQRRVRFTEDQVETLMKAFKKNCYPDEATVRKLAADLGLEESAIEDWLHNRRSGYPMQVPQDH